VTEQLRVEIDLDNSKAREQARAFRAEQRKLNDQLLSDAQVQERAQVELVRQTNREKVKAATESMAQARTAGVDSFAAVTAAAELSRAGVAALRSMIDGLATAYDKAGERSRALSAGFAATREGLGNLAYLQGTTATDEFVLRQARFGAATGMTSAESTALQTAFMNSGAQFVGRGRSLDEDQADRFQQGLGQMALARQLDPATVATMGGKMLGMRDYSKFGARGAEEALGDVGRTLAVLSAGSGEEGRLATEVGKLAAFSLNEDVLRGTFQDPKDVAKLISTVAESKVEGQAEAAATMLRATRGFARPKGGPSLKAAGVTPSDDPFVAIKKIGDWATLEAAKEGLKPQDILNRSFDDSLAAETLGAVYNKGVSGGVFAARERTAAEAGGPDVALEKNAEFLRSSRGMARLAQADIVSAQAEVAAKNADLTILRQQATARLIRTGGIDTNAANFNDYLMQKATFGMLGDPQQKRIDDEVQRMLMARSPAGTRAAPLMDMFNVSPTAREDDLNARMARITEAGGNPLSAAGEAGVGRQVVDTLQDIAKKVSRPIQAPPVRPMVGPPYVERRG
jgi:hypothetical protein